MDVWTSICITRESSDHPHRPWRSRSRYRCAEGARWVGRCEAERAGRRRPAQNGRRARGRIAAEADARKRRVTAARMSRAQPAGDPPDQLIRHGSRRDMDAASKARIERFLQFDPASAIVALQYGDARRLITIRHKRFAMHHRPPRNARRARAQSQALARPAGGHRFVHASPYAVAPSGDRSGRAHPRVCIT